jgi:hypothetical protein
MCVVTLLLLAAGDQVLWDIDVRPSDATYLALKVCGVGGGRGQGMCLGSRALCLWNTAACAAVPHRLLTLAALRCTWPHGVTHRQRQQANAPIYVKKSVWEGCSTPLRNSSTWATVNYLEAQRDRERRASSGGSSSGERHSSSRCVSCAPRCAVRGLAEHCDRHA